jgi:hypothetical protein
MREAKGWQREGAGKGIMWRFHVVDQKRELASVIGNIKKSDSIQNPYLVMF